MTSRPIPSPSPSRRPSGPITVARSAAVASALLCVLAAGCRRESIRPAPPVDPAAASRSPGEVDGDRRRFEALEPLASGEVDPELLLELAGLADRIADRAERLGRPDALDWARDGAAYSWFAAREGARLGRPPAWFERPRDLHNRSVARCLRAAGADPGGRDDAWRGRLLSAGIVVDPGGLFGAGGPVDQLLIADDQPLDRGLTPHRRPGWGVPLVAGRRRPAGDRPGEAEFHPAWFQLPATGLIVPPGEPDAGRWRGRPAGLVLVDPVDGPGLAIAPGRPLPIAADLTTPLRDQACRSLPGRLAWLGVLEPDRLGPAIGVYMTRPYDPARIPVVLIHGLNSSPLAWVGLINDLQADPTIGRRYQFWVASYPTGYPVPYSSARLRARLGALRRAVDPEHDDEAYDRMVVVGHSMGGLVARSLILDPGDSLGLAVFSRSPAELDLGPVPRAILMAMFLTRPEPAISRAIFLATPHRGSRVASRLIGRVVSRLVRRARAVEGLYEAIAHRYGLDAFQPAFRGRPFSGIDNLGWNSPLLSASADAPTAPGVPYHSIIGVIPGSDLGRPGRGTDGVVGYSSAHLEGADSELVVGYHHSLTHRPEVIAEVRRILKLHLDETDGGPR